MGWNGEVVERNSTWAIPLPLVIETVVEQPGMGGTPDTTIEHAAVPETDDDAQTCAADDALVWCAKKREEARDKWLNAYPLDTGPTARWQAEVLKAERAPVETCGLAEWSSTTGVQAWVSAFQANFKTLRHLIYDCCDQEGRLKNMCSRAVV